MVKIYALKCLENDFSYIGCTKSVAKRMREHRCLLNKGVHSTTRLQSDWKLYGAQSFKIEVLEDLLETAMLEDRRAAEMKWINFHKEVGKLYNDFEISFRPSEVARKKGVENARHVIGKRWISETNERRSLAQLGKPKGHGAKISSTKQARKRSDEIVSSAFE